MDSFHLIKEGNEIPSLLENVDGSTKEIKLIYPLKGKQLSFEALRNLLIACSKSVKKSDLKIVNVPFCVYPQLDIYICNTPHPLKSKLPVCKNCKYEQYCGGIPSQYKEHFGDKDIQYVPNFPEEVVIEITQQCNVDCGFCFNKHCFDKTRNADVMTTNHIKAIIDDTARLQIPFLRLTGGEPLIRKDVYELLDYAKSKGFQEVRLNTNALLITDAIAKKLGKSVDNILIGCNGWDSASEKKVTGNAAGFNQKIRAPRRLRNAGVQTIRAGTIAFAENVDHFDEFYTIITQVDYDRWEWYRPIAGKDSKTTVSKLIKLVDILLRLKRQGIYIPIVNAIPFCIHEKEIVNAISPGAKYDDGHSRLIVSPKGYAKPSYYIDVDLGDARDIESCWNHPFMQRIRNQKFIPDQCRMCTYKQKCMAGSRYAAKEEFSDYFAPDPLMPQ